jgi:hypothetical protein
VHRMRSTRYSYPLDHDLNLHIRPGLESRCQWQRYRTRVTSTFHKLARPLYLREMHRELEE